LGLSIPKKTETKKKMDEIEKNIDRVSEVRLLVHTKPTFKKKPEVFEILVNAPTAKEAWEYAKSVLGKELTADQIFKEGDYIDVVAITKGKGIQGPIKRFGARIQYRKAKETFYSSCHGAGRTMSRHKAIKTHWGDKVKKELEQSGIIAKSTHPKVLAEEAPDAYKDVDEVIESVHNAGISTKVARMTPLGVAKG